MATPSDNDSPDESDARKEAFDTEKGRFRGFLRYFLWLGMFGFGGPIATVGYMQRDLVDKRGWLTERDFLDGVALGQTMPGPLAAQVAMWVGYLQAGALRAIALCKPHKRWGNSRHRQKASVGRRLQPKAEVVRVP